VVGHSSLALCPQIQLCSEKKTAVVSHPSPHVAVDRVLHFFLPHLQTWIRMLARDAADPAGTMSHLLEPGLIHLI